jgi:hypothetical protein
MPKSLDDMNNPAIANNFHDAISLLDEVTT